jgi:hypothetical protein
MIVVIIIVLATSVRKCVCVPAPICISDTVEILSVSDPESET